MLEEGRERACEEGGEKVCERREDRECEKREESESVRGGRRERVQEEGGETGIPEASVKEELGEFFGSDC